MRGKWRGGRGQGVTLDEVNEMHRLALQGLHELFRVELESSDVLRASLPRSYSPMIRP